jgi:flagellar biosynthetic protein FlhB
MVRQQGHVARSHDLVAAFVCVAALGTMLLAGPLLFHGAGQMLRHQLSHVSVAADDMEYHVQTWRRLGVSVAAVLGPWLLAVCAAAYAIQAVQIGWLWLPHKVIPDLQRVDPARGLQRLLDPGQVVRALFLLLKLSSILGLAGWLFWQQVPAMQILGSLTPAELAAVSGRLALKITLWISLTLLLLGLIDYAWQRTRYERLLRLTPQDWRDDVKSVHNDVSSLRRRRSQSPLERST